MHFQKHEHYALLIMGELARRNVVEPLSLTTIATQHGVSLPFLKKIVRSLRSVGLVQSKEGVGGGYMIARKPEAITLWEIISGIDTTYPETSSVDIACPINRTCLPQHIRSTVMHAIEDRLRSITLQEVSL